MADKTLKQRLQVLKHEGTELLYADFGAIPREDGIALLDLMVAEIKSRPDNSVRLLVNTTGAEHDSRQSIEWKSHQPLFQARIKRVAIYGLSPLNRMAYAGYRMAARLMGQEDSEKLGQHFDSHEKALHYLVS